MRTHYVKPPQSGLQKPGSGSTHLINTDRASIKGLTVFRVLICFDFAAFCVTLLCDGWYSERKLYREQPDNDHHATRFWVAFSIYGDHVIEERSAFQMKMQMNREQKEKQIRREAKATLILFAICFVWNVGFAYGLSGTGARLFGLPVWWLISTPGMFIIAVIGVVILLKKVFVNFDLEDNEEGGDLNAK